MTADTQSYTVYRCYDADSNLLYVGATKRLNSRLCEHRKHREWWPQVEAVEAEEFATHDAAATAELQLIKTLKPLYNRNQTRYPSGWSSSGRRKFPEQEEAARKRLKAIRRARALTQRDLHDRSGVAVSTIVAIERGEVEPQIQTIRKLASALGVTPERLMVGEDL